VLSPGQEIADQEDKVKSVANAVWTDSVVKKHKEKSNELK